MNTCKTNHGSFRRLRLPIAAFVLSTALLAGCADMKFQAGRRVDVEKLQQELLDQGAYLGEREVVSA